VHPDLAAGVGEHGFAGSRLVAPVALHQVVAADGQLAAGVEGQDFGRVGRVDDFGFDVWQRPADGVDTLVHGVVRRGHGGHRARLRHAVADGQLGEVEGAVQLAHELGGDAGAGGDAGSEVLETGGGDGAVFQQLELGLEHGGDAVESGAFLFLQAEERGMRVEGFGGEDDGGPVRDRCHVGEDRAEAVEERWRAADDVTLGEEEAVADAVAIVEDGTMGQAGCFGRRGCAGGELDVDGFVSIETHLWGLLPGTARIQYFMKADERF
jgi:hypothetical protein